MVKILLIDDEEINNLIFSHILEGKENIREYHYENNGWTALQYLSFCEERDSFPDIIFVDLNMPEMHGCDFIEAYESKLFLKFPQTKLFVLTSSELSRDRSRCLQYPSVNGFITKSQGEQKLMEVIYGAKESLNFSGKKIGQEF